jgi:hypothetical protein
LRITTTIGMALPADYRRMELRCPTLVRDVVAEPGVTASIGAFSEPDAVDSIQNR